MDTKIALIGEYTARFEPHEMTERAIAHSNASLGLNVEASWLSTDYLSDALLERFDGIWIAPGSPYKDMEKTLAAIRDARENAVPCLGTCGGFQHMVLEYAKNVLENADAQHAEYSPHASRLFISRLECSLAGREMSLRFLKGSKVAGIYGADSASEQYYCNFGVNPEVVSLLNDGLLSISGSDDEGEVRVIELPKHPFFIGTLFVPQLRSTPESPHPLVSAFVSATAHIRPRTLSTYSR